MKIKAVHYRDFRGKTGSVELSDRTFITGPNGSGKSAIVNAAHFALKGKLPGYKSSEAFANADGDHVWAAVDIDDRKIERSLSQGDTLSETLTIDGEEMSGRKAEPILKVLLGKSPVLLDMPAFWELSADKMRRCVLKMIDATDSGDLVDREIKAREGKNKATQNRQAAEKTVTTLCAELAEKTRPIGDLGKLREEETGINEALDDLVKRIATSEASEKERGRLQALIDGKAGFEAAKVRATTETDAHSKAATDAEVKRSDLVGVTKPTKPEAPKKPAVRDPLPGWAKDIVKYMAGCFEVGIVGRIGVDLDAVEIIKKAFSQLEQYPESEALQAYEKDLAAYDKDVVAYDKALKVCDGALDMYWKEDNALLAIMEKAKRGKDASNREWSQAVASIEGADKAKDDLDKLGPGPDQADYATKAGLMDRRDGLRTTMQQLTSIETTEASIEKARITVAELTEIETKANTEIKAAKAAQAGVVANAESVFADRVADILPEGTLRIVDDGKSFNILWERDSKMVSRTTLSGGEQCLFDAALGHAMAPKAVVFIEAAEVDDTNMSMILDRLSECDFQIAVAAWNDPTPGYVSDGWTKITLEKE